MRLLFVGIKPSPELEKLLLANAFTIIGTRPVEKTKTKPDLIVFRPPGETSLAGAEKLRSQYPKAWIAILADKKWLEKPKSYNLLLACHSKNDVWPESSWEMMFWFCLQRCLAQRKIEQDREALHGEVLTLRRNSRELTQASEKLVARLEKNVVLASNIQRSLLPKVSPLIPGISVAVKFVPAAGRGGDYYDIFEFGDKKRFGILLADSKTHGMAAALLSVLLKTQLEEMKDRFPDSCSFLSHVNEEIGRQPDRELGPLALLYGILDRASLTFHYTSAGHLKPLLWRAGRQVVLTGAANPPIGGNDHCAFRENQISLLPGDLLTLHTDGLDEPVKGKTGSALERIIQILSHKEPSDPFELRNELMGLVDQHIENQPLKDDLTVIHLSIDERVLYVASQS